MSSGTYDPETEAKLDQWVEAKRARDFRTSDAIQRELQAQGIDTNVARPDPRKAGSNPWSGGKGAGSKGGAYDADTEAKLDEWVAAKRARDFATSDAIQSELEAQGIDTNVARPDPRKGGANMWAAGGGCGGGWGAGGGFGSANGGAYDRKTEAKLDEWVAAKRARDFTTSDAIQRELEMQGIDTNVARPDPKKGGANMWAADGGFGASFPGANGGAYDAYTEKALDEWVVAKRERNFAKSDAIQAELQARGIDTNIARPDPRKAGGSMMASPWEPWIMSNGKMMAGGGGCKGFGKGRWGPY